MEFLRIVDFFEDDDEGVSLDGFYLTGEHARYSMFILQFFHKHSTRNRKHDKETMWYEGGGNILASEQDCVGVSGLYIWIYYYLFKEIPMCVIGANKQKWVILKIENPEHQATFLFILYYI